MSTDEVLIDGVVPASGGATREWDMMCLRVMREYSRCQMALYIKYWVHTNLTSYS